MSINKVPKNELNSRMNRFLSAMDAAHSGWEMCAIVGDMSMYYLTGTICDGMLLIIRGQSSTLWVRRSYERAVIESELDDIRPMSSFRDVAESVAVLPDTLYLDMASATMEWYGILSKYMKFSSVLPIDTTMLNVRSVKSEYEIGLLTRAGKTVDFLLREKLPSLLREGMSEADLGADIFSLFIKNGYHGISRFSMKNAPVVLGHISFSKSTMYPSVFNGAAGLVGLCPAVPVLGSRDVKLYEGDLVYIDVGFGIDGYNVDKTLVYSFHKPQTEHVNDIHRHCLDLERQAAALMRPGARPSDIYKTVLEAVKPELRDCFMGTQGHTVSFLGHGVGLYINELPVIAKGFDSPLECGMTIAVEPKISIDGVGMVGSENTYLITEAGAVSLTGGIHEILVC